MISFETFIEAYNSCYVPHFHWLLVATKLLTAKLQSRYVKGSESEILERSELESEWDIYLRLRNPAQDHPFLTPIVTTKESERQVHNIIWLILLT